MNSEILSEVVEGIIGLVMIIGGFVVITINQTLAGVMVPLMVLVLVAYFGQKSSQSATNGAIKAMGNIAKSTQESTAAATAHTVNAAATMSRLVSDTQPTVTNVTNENTGPAATGATYATPPPPPTNT